MKKQVKQNSLFNMPKKDPKKTNKLEDKIKEQKLEQQAENVRQAIKEREALKQFVPKEGDEIIIGNLNDGIEGIVTYVDYPNLYNQHMYPIQCIVPKLNNMLWRTNMYYAKPRKKVDDE